MRLTGLLWTMTFFLMSCSSKHKPLMTDIEKESLKGNVESVKLYAYKYYNKKESRLSGDIDPSSIMQAKILTGKSKTDTIIEVPLFIAKFTRNGFYTEFEKYRHDSVLAWYFYNISKKFPEAQVNQLKPDSIYSNIYEHKKYLYNGNNLKSVLHFNMDGYIIRKENYTFRKNYIIDSVFFMNGGFLKSSRLRLSEFGIDTPRWAKQDNKLQFDSNRNLIVEKNIHYYYNYFDKYGNWIKATKYYDGPNKAIPVYLRRVITYYK